MAKRILNIVLIFTLVMSIPLLNVTAAEDRTSSSSLTYLKGENNFDNSDTRATLIIGGYLDCSVNGKSLKITGMTTCNGVMAQVGFKNVKVQRSSNGTSWTTEKTLGNFLDTDSSSYLLSTTYTVTGGYYYRVTADHYAKEQGWFFPGSDTIDNWTNSAWISA